MSLLKKDKAKKPLHIGGATATQQSTLRPNQVEKLAPCIESCPSGNDVRGWLNIIATRKKTKMTEAEAYAKAFELLAQTNPFPATLGRVCPHPCETDCNRSAKEGGVAINALERYLGDFALKHKLPLPRLAGEEPKSDSIGVIGGGPAGLSFAYQLARRGYPVTVYEKTDKAGGMAHWGIPFYRLPENVLQAEIQRVLDLGVTLKLNTALGRDVTVSELKKRHKALFIGIGADCGRLMRIPGEEGLGTWTGTGYLYERNAGRKVDLGPEVAVIGGGNTAIDAARMARRSGAKVTILYRRTCEEMPAIAQEIDDALAEDIQIEYLVAPIAVLRKDGKIAAVRVQRMELGEPDESGRRRPVPKPGSEVEIPITAIIAAISQEPDFAALDELRPEDRWYKPDEHFKVQDGVWAGGDVLELGLLTVAVGQGRKAAESVHAALRGLPQPELKDLRPPIPKERIKLGLEEIYPTREPVERPHRPIGEWLTEPDEEIALNLPEAMFLEEVGRCFSCGLCFGCERCWMFCTPACFVKVDDPHPGHFYKIKLETCDGCKKCGDECPCGFIDLS